MKKQSEKDKYLKQPASYHLDLVDKTSMSFMLKEILASAIKKTYPEKLKDLQAGDIPVSFSDNTLYGDYTSSVSFRLAEIVKDKPVSISYKIRDTLTDQKSQHSLKESDHNMSQNSQIPAKKDGYFSVLQDIEKIDVAGSGYINFTFSASVLIRQLAQVLDEKDRFGISQTLWGKKIMVEYTDPNPFKEFHIGHLISNTIGESLAYLLESGGARVARSDYFGDVGMHVAKAVWGMKEKLNILDSSNFTSLSKSLLLLKKKPIPERIRFLGQAYALGTKVYEEDAKAKEEIQKYNVFIYVAAQKNLSRNYGWKPMVNYAQYLPKGNEKEYELIELLYTEGREWSIAYFETIYKRLGTKFDYYHPESLAGEYGYKLVIEGLKKGIFEKSEGAVVYRGEKRGLHTRVFINKLGLPTYEAKDLGLAVRKYEDFQYDLSLPVTGTEIKEYFTVILSVLKELRPYLGAVTHHIGHGMVRLSEGKMSSRTGNIITAEWLIEEVKKKILLIMDSGGSSYPDKEKQEIAETLSIASVKYALLKARIGNDVLFDIDKSVSIEGDSAPYLIYTYARCRSIERKAISAGIENPFHAGKKARGNHIFQILQNVSKSISMNNEEKTLLREIFKFKDTVINAVSSLSPGIICSYVHSLAQAYNNFYTQHSVLGIAKEDKSKKLGKDDMCASDTSEREPISAKPATGSPQPITIFRIAITLATAQVIKNSLRLLGIKTVEKM